VSHAAGDVAPGDLALVQQLANSFDLVRGRDDLRDPQAAQAWLVGQGLLAPPGAVAASELALLHRLRAAVHGLCLANSGCELQTDDVDALNALAQHTGLRPRLERHESVAEASLEVGGRGALGSCGRLVAIVFEAVWSGQWPRLKACPGDACHYAFYDHTRNNSRMWCSMSRCGARSKMRAYRARRQADAHRASIVGEGVGQGQRQAE
jgi:predicted RNA-binding Zn ribbon-like protein